MPPKTEVRTTKSPDMNTCSPPERLKRTRNWADHEIDAMLRWLEDPINYAKTAQLSGHREEEWMSEMAQCIPTKTVRQICDRFHRHIRNWNLAKRKNSLPGWGVKASDNDSNPDILHKKQVLNTICKYFWRFDAIFSPTKSPLTKLAAHRDSTVYQAQSDQVDVVAPRTTLDSDSLPDSATETSDVPASGGLKSNETATITPVTTNSSLTITPMQSPLRGYPLIGIGSSPHAIKQTIEEIKRENAAHKELLSKGSLNPVIVQDRLGTASNTSFLVPEAAIGNSTEKIQGLGEIPTPVIASAAKDTSNSQIPKSNNAFQQNIAGPYNPHNPIVGTDTNSHGIQTEYCEMAQNIQERATHQDSHCDDKGINTHRAKEGYQYSVENQDRPSTSSIRSYQGGTSQKSQPLYEEKAQNTKSQASGHSTRSHQGYFNTQPPQPPQPPQPTQPTQPAHPAHPEYRKREINQDFPKNCISNRCHESSDKNAQSEHQEGSSNNKVQTRPEPMVSSVSPRRTHKPLQNTPKMMPSTPGIKRPAPDRPTEPSRISRPKLESPQSRPAAPALTSERQAPPPNPQVQSEQPIIGANNQAGPTSIDIRKYELDKDYELRMKKLDIELYLEKKKLQLEERRIELEERKLTFRMQQLQARAVEVENQRQAGVFLQRDGDVI
ncbi:hypothetical protein BZA77DRAFT_359578 [Pyronema omphalodes]|nr:hypothetical protein BZA77DRAFT_359578 [Pyronema omphalodes]